MVNSDAFFSAIAKIDQGAFDLVSLINLGDGLVRSGDGQFGLLLYKYWLAANPTHPLRHIAAFNCGSQLLQTGDTEGAKKHLGQAIEASPDFYPARLNYSSALEREGNVDGAVAELEKIVERLSALNHSNIGHKVQAHKSIARIRRSAEIAENSLRQAIEIDPTQRDLVQHWVNRRQGRCVWPALEPVGAHTLRAILERMAPLSMAAYCDDPLLQLLTARSYSKQLHGSAGSIGVVGHWPVPKKAAKKKIRVAYLSSDFCHHAVGYLMSDVFENHNRDRYEINVFNIGERNNDAIQLKIMGQVDHWEDIRGVADKAAAASIISRGVDILIDMNGHTNYQRTGLLALKPSPIIANWLGYPGTMGSEYHNYIIADDFLVPPAMERYYSEKVVRLPCYQPNGKLYPVPVLNSSRAELGLPEQGIVFCCFNGSVKITEQVFGRWMYILSSVAGSVIWLRGSPDDDFAVRLRTEATRRGVAPDRLVFLSFRSNTEYLGCHRYADIFLDTFPYGAHTTASDALRMGVPIVTLAGMSFASRVCGSLSHAAGLPDLVCDSPEQYVARAIQLGNDPVILQAVKQKLQASLPTCTLFNAPKLVASLENLFDGMWSDYSSGKIHRPDVAQLSYEHCIPPDATRVTSDFVSAEAFERRRTLQFRASE
jgi:predicted O-linked N-acetylglucosamine transferase (SPINDLY family)